MVMEQSTGEIKSLLVKEVCLNGILVLGQVLGGVTGVLTLYGKVHLLDLINIAFKLSTEI